MQLRDLALLLLAIIVTGCSSDNTAGRVAELNNANIKKVSNLYVAYRMHNGVGPKDAAALKKFASSGSGLSSRRLELMQIDPKNLDPIFISERDHKPFKIKPSVPGDVRTRSAVVFEETGIDGKRQVGFDNSNVLEVGDAKYKELWESKEAAPVSDPEAAQAAKKGG